MWKISLLSGFQRQGDADQFACLMSAQQQPARVKLNQANQRATWSGAEARAYDFWLQSGKTRRLLLAVKTGIKVQRDADGAGINMPFIRVDTHNPSKTHVDSTSKAMRQ